MNSEGLEKPTTHPDGHGRSTRLASPCVKLCRIEPECQLCQGCGRSLDEIARWTTMSEAEKASVWRRLAYCRQ